jgi:glycosyltransferase involved in cell wall biosynthesis
MYADNVYRRRGDRVATIDEVYAFMLFVAELRRHVDRLVLFGRAAPPERTVEHLLPEGLELVELPYYESLRSVGGVIRALSGSARAMWRGVDDVDTVWVFGPNPVGVLFALVALARGRRLALGVRQDTLSYYRSRLPGRTWAPAIVAARLLDLAYRGLARRARVTAVGTQLAERYGWPCPSVLPITVTLVRDADVAVALPERDWGRVRLLAVGRLDREKNPLLLVDALGELERREPGRFSLAWAGSGPLAADVARRAKELGVAVELHGFVPHGPELSALYRDAHAFVHVSLTEGVPAAIVEALAAGLPVVATAVGGVPALLGRERAAVLVPPADRDALVEAIARVAADGGLRARLFAAGVGVARERTIEAEARRIAAFLAA